MLVEKKLVVETFRRQPAERAADFARQLHRVDQVLAGHFIVDAKRKPAHRPIRFPLQLAAAAGDQRGNLLARLGVRVGDGSCLGIVRDDRHLQHDAGARRDRQERRIGFGALLAQRRQHDVHHRIEALQHLEQRRIETPGGVAGGRRHEFVVEAELVEEGAQPRVVVLGETCMRAERIGHLGQRFAEMLRHHLLVGNVVGHLAQAVHVVGERDQAGLDLVVGEHPEGVADHGGARHLAEGADMRQAGGAVAGFEDHLVLRPLVQARDDLARLFERPSVRLLGEFTQIRCRVDCRGRHLSCPSRGGQ